MTFEDMWEYGRNIVLMFISRYVLMRICLWATFNYPRDVSNDICAFVIITFLATGMGYEEYSKTNHPLSFFAVFGSVFMIAGTIYKIYTW